MNNVKERLARITNRQGQRGILADVLVDADVFIGVSAGGVLDPEMIKTMGSKPIIFALANPTPEIAPQAALQAGARVVGTGRSDYPNQVNNLLAFPGVFRGALDVRARRIDNKMKIAAARAIAGLVDKRKLSPEYVIPSPFDSRVAAVVAKEVARTALATGHARLQSDVEEIYLRTLKLSTIA
jgi:malate dehydrogenase (oxaloacetate-decarboxylating)